MPLPYSLRVILAKMLEADARDRCNIGGLEGEEPPYTPKRSRSCAGVA
jgi:hypothetical protein